MTSHALDSLSYTVATMRTALTTRVLTMMHELTAQLKPFYARGVYLRVNCGVTTRSANPVILGPAYMYISYDTFPKITYTNGCFGATDLRIVQFGADTDVAAIDSLTLAQHAAVAMNWDRIAYALKKDVIESVGRQVLGNPILDVITRGGTL